MRYRYLFVAALAAACSAPATAAAKSAYSMEILVDGRPLTEYAARGTTYVEALEGREYSIRLRNRTGGRVAIALSVDGLNTIDAKSTTTEGASKWILGPYQSITLDGWQVSSDDARRFFFTNEEASYGAWLGKTRDLGIVTAAVFREKERPIVRRDRRYAPGKQGRMESRAPGEGSAGMDADAGRSRKAAPSPEPTGAREMESAEAAPSDDYAATGIGRKVGHRVNRIEFEAEASPIAVLELRYEFHDALVRLSVLPECLVGRDDPLSRRERARGFEDLSFAPDPFE
jgi:hypothetical protein